MAHRPLEGDTGLFYSRSSWSASLSLVRLLGEDASSRYST